MSGFEKRHLGLTALSEKKMLQAIGVAERQTLIEQTIPRDLQKSDALNLPAPQSEQTMLETLRAYANKNQIWKNYLGMGYVDTITPPVILRNVLENPGWYTQYTPYQAEIAQGRLEALLNFQTMVMDLTEMEIANASLLDEATAAAEAMALFYSVRGKPKGAKFFIASTVHPQSREVIRTRAEPLGIECVIGDASAQEKFDGYFGAYVQYPDTFGKVVDYTDFIKNAHATECLVAVGTDLMSLVKLKSPGSMGADAVVGNTQCFGVPMGYGGPHAAFFATKDAYKRLVPGRIVGVSKDTKGRVAIRLSLQTREQHIRRDKATSNICTAQVLLAIMASMYAVYHGKEGLQEIANGIALKAETLATVIEQMGFKVERPFFQTLKISNTSEAIADVFARAVKQKTNLRKISSTEFGVTLDETTSDSDLSKLVEVILGISHKFEKASRTKLPEGFERKSDFLTHPVFNKYHSETEMLRYLFRLQAKDLSLGHSMIPLGSCTMKLNATAEMIPVTWPEFSKLHPFAPVEQAEGYNALIDDLEKSLKEITGFQSISFQPNAGSQGEYAGLLCIRKYHLDRGESNRTVCLIPASAHGTNPASAAMAGFHVVVVRCDERGNIDNDDLNRLIKEHAKNLGALMITYPSTHGVFEKEVRLWCDEIHQAGGLVYMDGANMNAQVGLMRPGDYGPDVCHLNLHKTFCIPHGGGGPGMGPIGVNAKLVPYLPTHPVISTGGAKSCGTISAAPFGSASILPISLAYIKMMGAKGLRLATEHAILSANYIATQLKNDFPVLYSGENGRVAHECILDLRPLKDTSGVEVEDVAKRLMDYGFHAPTVSFPVAGTLMIEPTESESLEEIDRFIGAMKSIRQEIREIELGKSDKKDNLLKNAPHTVYEMTSTEWSHSYTREQAAFPLAWVKERKFWPSVSRIDNVYGERNLMCACPSIEDYQSA